MLVKDIYGGAYGSLGLTGDLIASSFGKSATADKGTVACCVFVSSSESLKPSFRALDMFKRDVDPLLML